MRVTARSVPAPPSCSLMSASRNTGGTRRKDVPLRPIGTMNKDHTGSGIPFIVPIGLKGTSFRRVPPVFREADIKEHDGGAGTERAVTRIAEIVAMLKDDGAGT